MLYGRKVSRKIGRILVGVVAVSCLAWATGCGPSRAEKEREDAEVREWAERDRQEVERQRAEEARRQEADRKAAEETRVREEKEAKEREAEQKKQEEEQRKYDAIRTEVNGLPKPDESLPARPTGLKGKALVLGSDADGKSLEDALPEELKGKPGDADLVVFVVDAGRKVQTKTYEETGDSFGIPSAKYPGYRLDHRVRVVSWDSKTLLGDFTVVGDDPPGSVNIDVINPKDIVGDDKAALRRWIVGRFGEAPTFEKFLAATDEKEAADLADSLVKGGKDVSMIPYLGQKLKGSAGDMRYSVIRVLRMLSGKEVQGQDFFFSIEYPMGPESADEFGGDTDGWTQKWLDWAGARR